MSFLSARAAPSVEHADANGYARTVCVGSAVGAISVRRTDGAHALLLEASESLAAAMPSIIPRIRQLLDLDADPEAIEKHLAESGLAPRERLRAGLRVPGAFDPFELVIRAILGQQVSVKGASTLMSRFTARFGERIDSGHPALTHLAATSDRVADASVDDIRAIGMPVARAATIQRVAQEMANQKIIIAAGEDLERVKAQLMALPGIGPWTAEYVAMRALHWTDAFPASDLVLRRNAGASTPAQLIRAAERWRPWRAYAAMQLWSGINDPKS